MTKPEKLIFDWKEDMSLTGHFPPPPKNFNLLLPLCDSLIFDLWRNKPLQPPPNAQGSVYWRRKGNPIKVENNIIALISFVHLVSCLTPLSHREKGRGEGTIRQADQRTSDSHYRGKAVGETREREGFLFLISFNPLSRFRPSSLANLKSKISNQKSSPASVSD